MQELTTRRDLDEVWAHRRPAGVYRWNPEPDESSRPDGTLEVALEAAADTGWAVARMAGSTDPTKAGLMDQVADALAFPAWFGRNFDALADCLRDVPGPTVLVWDGWSALAEQEPDTFATARDVLEERTRTAPDFAVLLAE